MKVKQSQSLFKVKLQVQKPTLAKGEDGVQRSPAGVPADTWTSESPLGILSLMIRLKQCQQCLKASPQSMQAVNVASQRRRMEKRRERPYYSSYTGTEARHSGHTATQQGGRL